MERSQGTYSLYTQDGRRKYLTGSEREAFLCAARCHPRPDVATLCLVMALTGCRISEALSLTSASIEFEDGVIAIRSLKKRGAVMVRQVPVPETLLRQLADTHALNRTKLWPWSRNRAWQLIKAVMRDAGIAAGPHATPRGLRHGFGVHAIRSNIPLTLVQRWLGHASLATTSIYVDVVGPEEREIASRMWAPERVPPPALPSS